MIGQNFELFTAGSSIPFELINQGKVRDVYRYNDHQLLIITSDRISAFDCVLDSTIDGKGIILTRLAFFWLNQMSSIVQTQLKGCPQSLSEIEIELKPFKLPKAVIQRAMIVNETKSLPIEAIVRGYLIGSGYQEYSRTSKICGIELKPGLAEFAKLDEPIFTPATKEEIGQHDVNISFKQAGDLIGQELIHQVHDVSLKIYQKAYQFALNKGIIIADTKFEFGLDKNNQLTLIDEVLTPDSSRFYALNEFQKNNHHKDYSKQVVRDYLLEQKKITGKIPLVLSKEVIKKTIKRYQQINDILIN